MIDRALAALLYILPAYVSNGAPVLFGGGRDAIDAGRTLHGKPLLGSSKTWRGLLAGLALGTLTAGVLALLVPPSLSLGLSSSQWALAGVLLSFGAQAGDLFGSFLKRRFGIPPSGPALFADQLFFLFLALSFAALIYVPSPEEIVFLAVATLLLHPAANRLAFFFRLKRVPW